MTLPSWWQVTTPHKDIREGKLSEAIFAADLGDVAFGKAPLEYKDASTFFQKTYLTQGLKNLLENVLSRLSGGKGDPVIQLQTPFGGGKTHALLALYHVVKNRKNIEHLKEVSSLPKLKNVKVAVFIGTREETLKGRTPWGEIASQLDCYNLVKEYDEKRYTPGKKIIAEMFEKSQPVLILMDEIAEYVSKSPPELVTQVLAFCQEITEAIKVADNCVLVCTLPASAPYGEAGEKALKSLQQIFGRVETVYTPVEGMEIYEVIRKRLFEDAGDEKIRKKVAQSYFDLYQKLGTDVPHETKEIRYRDHIEHAYPFHPEFIDVLYERWGSYHSFQRTRGVLRLLAEVVEDLYNRKVVSPLIQSSLVNLERQSIRREFIKQIGNEFDSVVAADVAGKGSKAARIDQEMGSEYEKYCIARGIATSVFLYSFSAGASKDTTLPRIRLSLLREGIPSTIVGDAISKLEEELWYLHSEKKQYAFRIQPNLNRVILQKEDVIVEDHIRQELREVIKKNSGRDIETYLWPENSSDVRDDKNLKLAILSPDFLHDTKKIKEFSKEIFEKAGIAFRVYKNALFLLAMDEGQSLTVSKSMKRLLALKGIQSDKADLEKLTKESRDEIDKKLKETEKEMPFKVLTAYRHIAMLDETGLIWKDLGIPTIGADKDISGRIKQYLLAQERLLSRMTPKYILEKTIGKDESEKSVKDISELFLKTPGLPIPENEKVLLDAVAEGSRAGIFGVQEQKKVFYKQLVLPTFESSVIKVDSTPEGQETGIISEKKEGIGKEVGIIEKKKAGAVGKVRIRATIPWDKIAQMISGVIGPLKDKGNPPEIVIEISAISDDGYDRTTLDSKVKETLRQIGAEIIEWKEE